MYQRPMVMVFQEYDSTSVSTPTATLPPCIVGPCYHIIDAVEDEILALYAEGYNRKGIENGMFPNNAPGALIERESVKFRFKNAMVALAEGCGLATYSAKGNAVGLSDPESCLPLLEIGDYANFSTGQSYRIIGVNKEAGTVLLNRSVPSKIDTNTATISFERKVEDFTIDASESGKVLLDLASERFSLTGITMKIDGTEYPVVSSELYVGYRALRQDCSDIRTIYSIDECKGVLGKICPENPLAYGVSIALANTSVAIQALGVDSDDLEGYTAAKDRLEQQDPVYAIVPLTFDTGVLTMFKNHCERNIQNWKFPAGEWRLAVQGSPKQKFLLKMR